MLHDSGLIDAAEYQRARQAPLGVTAQPGVAAANRFPAYIDLVRRQLAADYPESALQGAGLTVFTGMSPAAQAYAEGAVTRAVEALQTGKRPPLQAGVVVTDVHGGDVLAVVGGREVAAHGFNRAVEARRPVGSLLKPDVYKRQCAPCPRSIRSRLNWRSEAESRSGVGTASSMNRTERCCACSRAGPGTAVAGNWLRGAWPHLSVKRWRLRSGPALAPLPLSVSVSMSVLLPSSWTTWLAGW